MLSKANLEETGNLVPETAPEAQGAGSPKTATFDSVICPPCLPKKQRTPALWVDSHQAVRVGI